MAPHVFFTWTLPVCRLRSESTCLFSSMGTELSLLVVWLTPAPEEDDEGEMLSKYMELGFMCFLQNLH